jgi:hypothetical protein
MNRLCVLSSYLKQKTAILCFFTLQLYPILPKYVANNNRRKFMNRNLNYPYHHSDKKPRKLLDQVRNLMRRRYYSPRTEDCNVHCCMGRYIFFHNKRHPKDMSPQEIEEFLTHLAVNKHVASSTQNQAFNAILFIYREVLMISLFVPRGIAHHFYVCKKTFVCCTSIISVMMHFLRLNPVCNLLKSFSFIIQFKLLNNSSNPFYKHCDISIVMSLSSSFYSFSLTFYSL